MSGKLKQSEAELRDAEENLEKLASAPDNAENRELRSTYEDYVKLLKEHIEAELNKLTPQAKEKYLTSRNSANDTTPNKEPEGKASPPRVARNFYANETVMAKWVSGDKSFYKARIISVTGSSADPVYMVKFLGYDDTETLRKGDVRPLPADKKRKFEEDQPASTHAAPITQTAPGVISAPATINPAFAEASKEPNKAGDGLEKANKMPRKVKPKKELEEKQSKWQAFTAQASKSTKFKKGISKKDSQFRTSDAPNSRVGFTGSGQPMKKDPIRKRHVYEEIQDD